MSALTDMHEATADRLQAMLMAPSRRRELKGGVVYVDVMPRVMCADGFSISVQASSTHYCTPRTDDGPWYEVECGFPSKRESSLMQWAEDADRPTETVYGWVPLACVVDVLVEHGGIT